MPTVIFVLAQTYLDEGLFKASKSAITKNAWLGQDENCQEESYPNISKNHLLMTDQYPVQ